MDNRTNRKVMLKILPLWSKNDHLNNSIKTIACQLLTVFYGWVTDALFPIVDYQQLKQ